MKPILSIILGAFLSIWHGFVLKVLWGWFLVPQFGFPPIGLAHAIGLSLLVGLVAHQASSNFGEDERLAQSISWALASPGVALLAGWIARQFL